jgi:thiamine-monophosphate kinase
MASEDKLIERVRRRFASTGKGLRVGIGDDAAVLRPKRGAEWVITTDAFLENVHFLRKAHPAEAVGYKALARATSDIAAMGARTRCFFLTVGLPEALTGKWLDSFLDGMARAAGRFDLALAGGDTTQYPLFVASLTVLGEVDQGKAVLRSGAKPGDLLFVSGALGEAELGLRLTRSDLHEQKRWAGLARKHFYPEPRLELGEWLGAGRIASSMIDISDGLSTDLGHICEASGVGAVVWAAKVPVVQIPSDLRGMRLDALELALNGGEDYELLFTVPKKLAGRLPRTLKGSPMTMIGEITRLREVLVRGANGQTKPLRPGGWDPFREKR